MRTFRTPFLIAMHLAFPAIFYFVQFYKHFLLQILLPLRPIRQEIHCMSIRYPTRTSDSGLSTPYLQTFSRHFAFFECKVAAKTTFIFSFDHIFRLFAPGFLLKSQFLDACLQTLGQQFSLKRCHYSATF